MQTLDEQALGDLARSISASGRIIEAHADRDDTVCKVVIELGDALHNLQLREALLQLWYADGFIATTSRDGLLLIDGLRDSARQQNGLDLIGAVAHQIKAYTRSSMQQDAQRELSGSPEMAFLAQAAEARESAPATH